MSGPTKLCVARHGETDWNNEGILQGWVDVSINDNGRRQAVELADLLAAQRLARIYTSPLRRAAETAEIIARRWQIGAPITHQGLKERGFGDVEGKSKSELARTDPELLQEIVRRNPVAAFGRGEPLDCFAGRVVAALQDIGRDNRGARVLVVTHGWVMDVITRHVRRLPRSAVLDIKRKNIECVWLDVFGGSMIAEGDSGQAHVGPPPA
jgi:probable phosphoglycerate mutase